jgi:NADPH-dependent 2,4-dienoyl-CoA reductase/sulfur reductase-like enzyme
MTSAAPDAGGTETRRLRLGRTLWERSRLKALPSEALTHDVATDVVVVGAGISGALVTEALVSAGLRVRVVDRRGPALGSTIASTALLLYDTDTPLSQLSERMGRDRAERAWRRSRLAVTMESIGGLQAGSTVGVYAILLTTIITRPNRVIAPNRF